MTFNKTILSFLSLLIIVACDDSLNQVGMDTKPDRDEIKVLSNVIYLDNDSGTGTEYAKTCSFDSIYFGAKNQATYLLGNFYDPVFGSLKSDYVCQFHYSSFPDYVTDSIKANRIDSVHLKIYYRSWAGDSLALMEAAVYPVKQSADYSAIPYRYTNIDLYKEFVAPAKPWATKVYTAHDMSISDSIYTAGYYKNISIDVTQGMIDGQTIGDRFVSAWINTRDSLQSIVNFTKFFKGLYITTISGQENMLNVYGTSLYFYYTKVSKANFTETQDTTYFDTADDIRISCQYKNDNKNLTTDSTTTYIKSPAGVYTQYTLPIQKIRDAIDGRNINSVRFSVTSYPKDDWKYTLNPPTTLMLIRKDSLTSFFESSRVIAAPTAYKATFGSYKYDFADISAMVREAIKEEKSTLDVVLVPIREAQISSTYGSVSLYTIYDITPSYVKLRKGKDFLQLDIRSSKVSSE
jgi:hypothetical protein